jgi:hypothetical protein
MYGPQPQEKFVEENSIFSFIPSVHPNPSGTKKEFENHLKLGKNRWMLKTIWCLFSTTISMTNHPKS